MKLIENFRVGVENFSDHMPIILELILGTSRSESWLPFLPKLPWRANCRDEYRVSLERRLQGRREERRSIEQEAEWFVSAITRAAGDASMRCSGSPVSTKPWWDWDCTRARDKSFASLRLFRLSGSAMSRVAYVKANSDYKALCARSGQIFKLAERRCVVSEVKFKPQIFHNMSASMEDNMDVDEENMQMDEDPAVGELPMSTDEDSVQDPGAAMKVVDDVMASDSPDVDITEGHRARNDGPTEMESDTIAEEAPSLVRTPDKTGEDSLEENDIGSICTTEPEKINPEAAEDNPGEIETEEGAATADDPKAGRGSSLSEENELDEQETANTVDNDESSQNNDGGDDDPLNGEVDSRTELETGDNSNVTSATEESTRDPFAVDTDGNSSAATEQRISAATDDNATAGDVAESSSNDDGGGKSLADELNEKLEGNVSDSIKIPDSNLGKAGGKNLAEELSEQLGKSQQPQSADDKEEGQGKEKPREEDHISIDDASSVGGADADNVDHVSINGSSDDEVDHVSVDSDSDSEDTSNSITKTAGTNKDKNDSGNVVEDPSKSSDQTKLMIDVARAEEAADDASDDLVISEETGKDDGAQKSNTVDLVESDDESESSAGASIRPKSSESLKGQITLIGKMADPEMIVSDGPIVVSTATVSLEKAITPLKNQSSSSAESLMASAPDTSRLALKSQYSVKKLAAAIQWKCLHCTSYQRCTWKILIGATYYYVCSDKCLEAHRAQRRQIIESGGPPSTHIIQIADVSKLKKKCSLCSAFIPKNKVGSLTWEVMNFCDEDCLSKYQSAYTSTCCNCNAVVSTSSMGKYCVRFGHEVKQFCTPLCLDTYKKGIKTCSYCQKNLQDSSEGFLAAVGGKDQFRDFCSQDCLEKYDCICNNSSASYTVDNCIVCDNIKVTQFELLSPDKVAKLCSDVCLAAYKFVNNIEVGICGMCNKYYDKLGVDESVTFQNDVPSTFCSKHCMNINVISKRKIVPCSWCKAKKYNFDMVYRRGTTDDDGLFVCSVNCLALHSVSLKALPATKIPCSYCKKLEVSTYHITMSDASIRHFCSYDCVITFQSAFNVPVLNANIPVPEGAAKKVVRPSDTTVNTSTAATLIAPSAGPTIQSVGTLKSIDGPPSLVPTSTANKSKHTTLKIPASFCFKPPEMKNKWTQMSVCSVAKCVTCKPKKGEKDVQCDLGPKPVNGQDNTPAESAKENDDSSESRKTAVIPIPVPIYIPHPMAMYTLPSPVPIPIPVPIIVPIIIPTSLENMDRVIDTMKEILEKSLRPNQSSSPPTAGQSSGTSNVLTISGGRKKRDLEDDDSDDEEIPSKRSRVEDVTSPETSNSLVKMKLKYMLGPNTWRHFVKNWNESLEESEKLETDILSMRPHELNRALAVFVREARKDNGDEYRPDLKFYLCLGIQYYLYENGRVDDIFGDTTYEEFTDALDIEARKFNSIIDSPVSRVGEEHLWESMQLGANTPQVLLMTIMYFISLRFNLWTLEEHMQLSFNSFSKYMKTSSDKPQGSKVVKLILNSSSDSSDPKKQREFEFSENKKDLTRCPVRLYEFYIIKCPENIKTHNDRFYLMPETSCVPESPVWYRSLALPPHIVEKMLNRVKMIKEIRDSMHEKSATSVTEDTI
ncbi:hypothetical protein GE061_018852 [Apolygus lucorum]|uniref:TRASH domain-containing protein n=1 Tax=Apolygus lucorum TaxID=248454 RepID=A0A8S9X8P9_APOLU|nr:hypothetical protein GE061_018852 [Apolygus lucorum]